VSSRLGVVTKPTARMLSSNLRGSLWATLRQDPTAPAISSVCTVGPTPSIHVTPREESSPRWTSQIRPYVDRPNPAIGRAPKFGESVLPHHHLPLQIGGRGCEACGRRQGGIAGARESPGVGVIPGYGVTRDRRSWRSLGRSPIRANRIMGRSARPGGGCASSAGRRSARARGGAGGPGRPRRRRCRRGVCPSPRRGDWTSAASTPVHSGA